MFDDPLIPAIAGENSEALAALQQDSGAAEELVEPMLPAVELNRPFTGHA
jgi:hypothetical protein